MSDFWDLIRADDRLANARRKLSMHELRTLFQHARDSLQTPPKPDGDVEKLSAIPVPYSSVVGGGLTLNKISGGAGFIVMFIGASNGITKEETEALSEQFRWFVNTYGCAVPKRAALSAASPKENGNER